MSTYAIRKNNDFNSLEISFEGKPSEAVREALKALHFRWHGVRKLWYGYKDEEAVRTAIANAEAGTGAKTEKALMKKEKVNKYGVKVGDLFSASWGYDQTNVDFFQIVALVGESSVRVREVRPQMVEENPVSGMSSDRTYRITSELLPPSPSSVFIKDQEKGDLKRIQPGYCEDPEEAKRHCIFRLSSFANAHKCNGDKVTCYESWYA